MKVLSVSIRFASSGMGFCEFKNGRKYIVPLYLQFHISKTRFSLLQCSTDRISSLALSIA